MKKVLFLALMVLMSSGLAWAGVEPGEPGEPTPVAALFAVDDVQLAADFAGLNRLEAFLLENGTLSYADLQATHGDLLSELGQFEAGSPLAPAFSIADMDWGAFAWGFLCCLIGFFVVAINGSKDSFSKTSYWIGVVVSSVLGAITGAIGRVASQ